MSAVYGFCRRVIWFAGRAWVRSWTERFGNQTIIAGCLAVSLVLASRKATRRATSHCPGDEFFIDLLFYRLKRRCYVVVELKTTLFKPEYARQSNFYLSAIGAQVKAQEDRPTIGLLLCKEKNRPLAE